MKVIVASYAKTGTKSIHAALEELGYSVYDYPENWHYHNEEWLRILEEGGTVEDFKKMYKDVDAVMDMPAFYFWEEISLAFPEAKVCIMFNHPQTAYLLQSALYALYAIRQLFIFICLFDHFFLTACSPAVQRHLIIKLLSYVIDHRN